ncbi:MAG: tRNA pseudouridine(38-40) synthase TruA [Dehalococcoidia bacterium]|nr:tRNA pseudouridine(38-40) synthase TruA [Dehalococcoidia bacterium]
MTGTYGPGAASPSLALPGARKIALVLEYEGTAYQGFQVQFGKPSIQGELQRALERLYETPMKTWGASRTDSGVHAEEQVVTFWATKAYPTDVLRAALNFHLPDDIKVREAWEAPGEFNPRRHALSRVYEYAIWNGPYPSPLRRRTAHHIPLAMRGLDEVAMDRAARTLEGEHDLFAFTTAEYARHKPTVRHVFTAQVQRHEHLVSIVLEANAFLPHQVRRTAGALVHVGLGRMTHAEFAALVDGPQRKQSALTLPARGLTLKRIAYADFPPSLALRRHVEQSTRLCVVQ